MKIAIRPAQPAEADQLTEIACRAKAHWGYSAEQMAAWKPAFLTITNEYIERHSPWVAVDEAGGLLAFAALEQGAAGAVLEHLWVLPAHIGRGIGSRLFHHIAARTGEFTFTSDPQADGFYQKLGAQMIGQVESKYQGRALSLFRYSARASIRSE